MVMPWLTLGVGVVACSTAVILIKATHTPPLWLVAERLLFAALIIAPFAWRDAQRRGGWNRSDLRASVWPALFLAVHFITWVMAARLIPAANSTLIANVTPVLMPLVAWLLLREHPSARELLATALGLSGVMVLTLGGLDASGDHLFGNGLCIISVFALTVYLALARRRRQGSLWLYVAPLYAMAGIAAMAAALVVEGLPPLPTRSEITLVLALTIVPTVIGHTLMNRAMGELRPQTVSVTALGIVPCAALMAWALWGEVPSPPFWVALAACTCAIALVALPQRRVVVVAEPAV